MIESDRSVQLETEIAVLGGGPAGAAAALSLAEQGIQVEVLQASDGLRHKTVETLSPPARPFLEQIAIWTPAPDDGREPVYGSRSQWGSDAVEHSSYVFHPHGNGWRLDRARFDAALQRRAVERGVRWRDGLTMVSLARSRGRWELGWTCGGHSEAIEARYLIDATGRRAWVGRQCGAKRIHHDNLVAVAARVEVDTPLNAGSTLIEAVEPGWWYSVDLPEVGRREAVFFTDHDLPAAKLAASKQGWLELFQQAPETSAGYRGTGAIGVPRTISSRSSILDCAAGDGWLAVGDAACTQDPLLSNGLVTALRSGLEGAAVAKDQMHSPKGIAAQAYARRVAMHFDATVALLAANYRMETRWRSAPFWSRRRQLGSYSPAAAK